MDKRRLTTRRMKEIPRSRLLECIFVQLHVYLYSYMFICLTKQFYKPSIIINLSKEYSIILNNSSPCESYFFSLSFIKF